MPYRYLEHTADAAIEATGETLEQAFAEAGRAMLALMVNKRDMAPDRDVEIEVTADSLEELLVQFLSEILAEQGTENLIFTDCWVREIMEMGIDFALRGKATGVKPERVKEQLGQEVKGVSYLGLKVEEESGIFKVQCVVDM
jgi:SHS2 domain-containing protein